MTALEVDNTRLNVLRNALYHTARRRSYEFCAKASNLAVIILGTAAVSDALGMYGVSQVMIGAAVAIVGALQLVLDFGGHAREHQVLQRDYYRLLAEIEAADDPTPADVKKWRSEMIRISGDEPPVLRAIDAKAYNDALDAINVYPSEARLKIPLYHRILGNFLHFEGHHYRKLSELAARD